MRPVVLVLLASCLPAIPHRAPAPAAAMPPSLPVVAPCALVHLVTEDDLSNGARGWFRGTWTLAYPTFVLRLPRGVVLVDAAFGDTAAADVDAAPLWFRLSFGAARAARPLAALLAEAGVRPDEVTDVLVTHAHWDHSGGLPQLPRARVHVAEAEAAWVRSPELAKSPIAMPGHFAGARIEPLRFDGPPYEGFDASHDVFGDGSVVAVPTPGHTPGATSWFVNSGDGRRWLFVGDAAWVKEGVEEPASRGRLASWLVDWNLDRTADSLSRVHAVFEGKSARVVTSHDERTWTDVPRCARAIEKPRAP